MECYSSEDLRRTRSRAPPQEQQRESPSAVAPGLSSEWQQHTSHLFPEAIDIKAMILDQDQELSTAGSRLSAATAAPAEPASLGLDSLDLHDRNTSLSTTGSAAKPEAEALAPDPDDNHTDTQQEAAGQPDEFMQTGIYVSPAELKQVVELRRRFEETQIQLEMERSLALEASAARAAADARLLQVSAALQEQIERAREENAQLRRRAAEDEESKQETERAAERLRVGRFFFLFKLLLVLFTSMSPMGLKGPASCVLPLIPPSRQPITDRDPVARAEGGAPVQGNCADAQGDGGRQEPRARARGAAKTRPATARGGKAVAHCIGTYARSVVEHAYDITAGYCDCMFTRIRNRFDRQTTPPTNPHDHVHNRRR